MLKQFVMQRDSIISMGNYGHGCCLILAVLQHLRDNCKSEFYNAIDKMEFVSTFLATMIQHRETLGLSPPSDSIVELWRSNDRVTKLKKSTSDSREVLPPDEYCNSEILEGWISLQLTNDKLPLVLELYYFVEVEGNEGKWCNFHYFLKYLIILYYI